MNRIGNISLPFARLDMPVKFNAGYCTANPPNNAPINPTAIVRYNNHPPR
ncbi:MAG: hypothetical protein O8C63_02340 [Candidatus Methanoperedens sp.]|nr:hypothetical protein [Candidatus Methanoperedens sp.]